MRLVGTLPDGLPAGGLLAALSARGLEVELRDEQLWCLEEDRQAEAAELLAEFLERPDAAEWRHGLRAALREAERERASANAELAARGRASWRRERRLRRAWQGALSHRPLTLLLMIGGAFAALASAEPEPALLLPLMASLYWIHELGSLVESLRGSRRFGLLVLSLAGTTQLCLASLGFGVAGLAGVAYGLLGYAVARDRLDPEAGLGLPRGLLPLMAAWLLASAVGAAPLAVFAAQCAGLAAGLFVGLLPPVLARSRAR